VGVVGDCSGAAMGLGCVGRCCSTAPGFTQAVMFSGFGGVGLLESVMLTDSEEALRCRGAVRPSTAAV